MSIWEIDAWKLIMAGGPIMVPIILCSIIALGIVIEKTIYFSMIKINFGKFKNQIFEHIRDNKIREAIELCESHRAPVAKILKAGLLKASGTREEIREAMEDVSLFEIPKLEKRLNVLSTIAHIAPLLGLLGTVTGMTGSFHTIQMKSTTINPVSPSDLAGSIWEALLTTVAGLMVAIPTFVAYNYCVSRVNHNVLEMERAATELINFLHQVSQTEEY